MKHGYSAKAICPFYRHEAPSVIYCDGAVEMTVLHLAFASRSDCTNYKKRYCCKDYFACRIMRMLAEDGL